MTDTISVETCDTMHKAQQLIKNTNFNTTISTYALQCPIQYTGTLLPLLKKYNCLYNTHKYQKLKHVIDYNANSRLVLLNEHSKTLNDLHTTIQNTIQQYKTEQHDIAVIPYNLTITYDNLTAEQILTKLLPNNITIPASYETIGHVIHLNLNTEQLPYKYIIGTVLQQKINNTIQTVINKVGTIENEYRVYQIELLAGKPDYLVSVRENNCIYKLDLSKVYWNSKLSTEHQRIVSLFKRGDTVVDMCCGIGPFVIPALKQQCTVYANDLNPDSIYWLKHNIQANKLHTTKYHSDISNMDGREFMRQTVQQQIQQTTVKPINHILMNLPALSISFCDVFLNLYDTDMSDDTREIIQADMPIVHCHCFAYAADATNDAVTRLQSILSYKFTTIKHTTNTVRDKFDYSAYSDMNEGTVVIHNVRNVAPNKDMLCVSFRIPVSVAFGTNDNSTINEPNIKKHKSDHEIT